MYMEENGSAVMLGTKRLPYLIPEVNIGEHVTHMPLPTEIKDTQSGFET